MSFAISKDAAKMEVSSMYSSKGSVLLIVNNYKFHKARVSLSGEVCWRCSQKSCRAVIYTVTDVNLTVSKSNLCHNHSADETITRQKLSNSVKRKAQADLFEKPAKIIHQELKTSTDTESLTTDDLNLIRRNIYMARRQVLPPLPKTTQEVFATLDWTLRRLGLFKKIDDRQSGALNVQPASNSPTTPDVPPGPPVNNMSQTQGSMPRTAATVHPFSVDGRQMATRQTQMYQQSMYSPYPQYSTAKQQPNVLAGNYPIHPDVKFRRLPFYDVLADLLKPSSLVPQSNQRMQEGTFYFHLTPQQATDVASSRDIRPGVKCDYVKQVQMRFCLLETSCEQDDYFPPNVIVKVNNKLCPLPNPIPTNKPGVEPKRPPRPVNITQMVKLSPTVANTITVSWAADYGRGYAISVSLVHKLSSMDLLQRLKLKGIKNADHTRAIIKEKLNDDGDEIATTSLRVSLMCPLGKMRMSTPCRPMTCGHLQCFDASLFLQMNERKPTWNCPVCDKPALYDNLVIDGYFTEVLCSSLLSSECNEIQLNKDGTWCIQTPEKKNIKIDKPTVIGIDDSIEIIGDDIEIVSSNIAATSSTDKSAEVPKLEESRKKDIVDLTLSDDEDEEPASKVRAIATKPDSTSISSSSNQSRVTTTPGPSSVSSSGYPASPSVINLDSPSPPRSPQQTSQLAPQQQTPSSCMMAGQTNGNSNQTNIPFMSPNSMPYLDLEGDAAVGNISNITFPTTY